MDVRSRCDLDSAEPRVGAATLPSHGLGRVQIMRRHSRQGHLTSRLGRIADNSLTVERRRSSSRRLRDRLSAAARARIVEERRDGATMTELSRRYGVSDYALRMFFAEEGLAPSRSSPTREQVEQIAVLHQAGASALEVSRRVGVPDSTVRLELTRLRAQANQDAGNLDC